MNRRINCGRTGGGPRGRRPGFTLIELLVVVSIIALLIAILLPSLKRARDQAKDVQCKANLRSMGQAFTMYAMKYNGVWPPAMDTYGQQNRWPVPFHKAGIVSDELARFDSGGNQLSGGKGKSIFLCPSEKAPRIIPDWDHAAGPPHAVDRVEVGGSFAISDEMHRRAGKIDRGMTGSPGNPAIPPYFRGVDHCRRPSAVFAVMGNYQPLQTPQDKGWRFSRGAKEVTRGDFTVEGGGFWVGYRLYDGTPVTDPSAAELNERRIGGRHNGHGNGLFMDTHVDDFEPATVRYDQVSWEPWRGPELPPGGL